MNQQYGRFLYTYIRPHAALISLIGILLIPNEIIKVFLPRLIRDFIDHTTGHAQGEALQPILIQFGCLALISPILSMTLIYLTEHVSFTITNTLREKVFIHCLNLDKLQLNTLQPGQMIERIDGDAAKLNHFFTQFIFHLISGVLIITGIICSIFLENQYMGIFFLCFTGLMLGGLHKLRYAPVPLWKEFHISRYKLFGFLAESLKASEDIASHGNKGYVISTLHRITKSMLKKLRKAKLVHHLTTSTDWVCFGLATIVIFAVGSYLFLKNEITIGTVYLMLHYLKMLSNPLDTISRQFEDFQQSAASIGRLQDLLTIPDSMAEKGGIHLSKGPISISCHDLCFSYSPETPILKQISFTLANSTSLGIIGKTGSGKTTLANLIMRLLDSDQGTIRVNGHDIKNISRRSIQERFGLVAQNFTFFADTLRENLRLYHPGISDKAIVDTIQELGLADWFQGLPQGLDRMIHSDESGFSAGETQLFALIQLFLFKKPSLLIFDESTSRLDPVTEAALLQAIQTITRKCLTIVISHHPLLLRSLDHIILLKEGKIAYQGPFRDVLVKTDRLHGRQTRCL